MSTVKTTKANQGNNTGSLFMGTGFAVASLILLPAVATRLGLGTALTGALRIALMKASYRTGGASKGGEGEVAPPTGLFGLSIAKYS